MPSREQVRKTIREIEKDQFVSHKSVKIVLGILKLYENREVGILVIKRVISIIKKYSNETPDALGDRWITLGAINECAIEIVHTLRKRIERKSDDTK